MDIFRQWFTGDRWAWILKDDLPALVKKELENFLGSRPIDREYLIELGMRCTRPSCLEIVVEGNLRLLKAEYKCPELTGQGDIKICRAAAEYGHLECLKYLHEQGWPWEEWTIIHAARNGRLDCLKYAHEQGCPRNSLATVYAARGGHLDCLKYLLENGCSWGAHTMDSAHPLCLEYLKEHGCPDH